MMSIPIPRATLFVAFVDKNAVMSNCYAIAVREGGYYLDFLTVILHSFNQGRRRND